MNNITPPFEYKNTQSISHECKILGQQVRITSSDSATDTIRTPALLVYVDHCMSKTDIAPLNNPDIFVATYDTFGWSDSVKDRVFFPEIAYHYPEYSIIATADAGKDMRLLANQYAGKTTCLCFTNSGTSSKEQMLANLLKTDGFKKLAMWPIWYSFIKVSAIQVTYYDLRQNKQKQKLLNLR